MMGRATRPVVPPSRLSSPAHVSFGSGNIALSRLSAPYRIVGGRTLADHDCALLVPRIHHDQL